VHDPESWKPIFLRGKEKKVWPEISLKPTLDRDLISTEG
jgi:hypothetical protein